MKKIFTFCVSLLTALSLSAYDFQSGDLFYNITSSSAPYTVEVTQQSQYYNSNYSGVDTIVIPETVTYDSIIYSVTSIGESAFNHSKLTTITIPNSVTSIGDQAFQYCTYLKDVTIGNRVESIGTAAFNNCSSLRSIIIPQSVKYIYNYAFVGASLNSIYVNRTIPPTLNPEREDPYMVLGTGMVDVCYIPCGKLASYQISEWKTKGQVREFVERPSYLLTVQSVDKTMGTATITQDIDCETQIATIAATPYDGYRFVQWSDGNTDNPRSWVVKEDTYLEAIFEKSIDPTWQITYTSTDGNIVTPNATDVFGANIVSNTYEDGQGVITFDGPVTSIGGFNHCFSLTTITIPNSVISIQSQAFYLCQALTSINIPNNVTSIGDEAFYDCRSLTSISLPNTIKSIGRSAFSFSEITSIIIPSSMTEIEPYAFHNCNRAKSIIIPNSIRSIGEWAFHHCQQLSSITIPNSVTSIGDNAFSVCDNLDTINIESTRPPALGTGTFDNFPTCHIPCGTLATYQASDWANQVGVFEDPCYIDPTWQILYTSSNDSIVTPNKTDVFGANIVSNTYEIGQGVITFDGPVTIVGDSAFHECSTLTSISIPKSVTSIGNNAFNGCTFLSSITIPNGVTTIGANAFLDCSSLTSITVPNSVTSVGLYAFTRCSSLASIVVESDNTKYDSRNGCNAVIETVTNKLIVGCKNTIIPNSITSIGAVAFGGCFSLTSITIPNSVTSIGYDAFIECSSLTSITIPNSVTSISSDAFRNCSSLDRIRVEATNPPILKARAFEDTPSPTCYIPCGTLDAYQSSDWAQYVSEFVEEGCAPIQMCGDDLYWEYADGVLTITGTGDMYDYATDTDVPWYDVRGDIKTVSLPNAMTKIGQNAFYKCTAMTTINMPTSLTAIGEKAFAQDTKLTGELTLPASLTTIDERAFFNCKAVTAFHIEATTPPTLQDKAFDYVVSPIHVPCGYGHVYGKHAQWGMLNLEMCELLRDNVYYYPINGHTARAVTYHSNPTDTIVIPSAVVIDGVLRTVTEVADFAFTDCDNLPAIYFNEGLEHIGERAFVRCYGLKGTITLPTTLTTIGERAFSYCDNVEKYLLQAMTPPVLGADVFTGNNKNALFYISCEAMDDYKIATNWSSLKSRLRDACLNIYHYNTPLGTNGVYTTEDTLVASIYYRRQFTPYRWETLYLPFEVDRVTVLEDGEEFDLRPWNIITGGDYYLAKPDGMLNLEILFDFTDELEAHTPYIIQFVYDYYRGKIITFYGKESWNKLSTSFEVLSSSAWMQIAGNTTLQDQLLEKPVYMLRSGLDFILQKTTTTLHPFECYVMPYTVQSGAPARMSVRLRDDVATAVESMKGNESRLAYTINGNTLTVYPQGQAFSIYSLNGALIYSCEAGKEAVDCELNSGCYLLHAGTEAHKIML